MTDRGLLAACREFPADMVTRGIYADWLEEHGDAASAKRFRTEGLTPWELMPAGRYEPGMLSVIAGEMQPRLSRLPEHCWDGLSVARLFEPDHMIASDSPSLPWEHVMCNFAVESREFIMAQDNKRRVELVRNRQVAAMAGLPVLFQEAFDRAAGKNAKTQGWVTMILPNEWMRQVVQEYFPGQPGVAAAFITCSFCFVRLPQRSGQYGHSQRRGAGRTEYGVAPGALRAPAVLGRSRAGDDVSRVRDGSAAAGDVVG